MKKMTEKQRKVVFVVAIVFAVFVIGAVTAILWKQLGSLFSDPASFRVWVEDKGVVGKVFFVAMSVLQILLALIPGEPLEIAAGFAFGAVEGTLLCLLAIAMGSALVFLLVRSLGIKMVEVFFSIEKIRSLRILQNHRRFEIILFWILFIPGTPKDLISYFVGLTKMKLSHWILLTTIARIPSVLTSTIGGDALGEENYAVAVVVFAVSAILSLVGMWIYDRITRRKKEKR